MPGYQGREHHYTILLDGVPFVVANDERGVPLWQVTGAPEIASHPPQISEEERQWHSWHGGFGYSQTIAPDTYHYGVNCDPRFPRSVIMGPLVTSFAAGGTVTGFFEQSSLLYVLAGRYIKQVNTATDACLDPDDAAQGKDLGATHTARDAQTFDALTIVTDYTTSEQNHWSFTGTVWHNTTHPVGSYLAKFWAGTYYALARSFVNSSTPSVAWVSSGLDPGTAANWAATYAVGETTAPITELCGRELTLFIAKTDGLYYTDSSGRVPNVVPAYTVDANNGIGTMVDSYGAVWYPTVEGYYRYESQSGAVADCSPGRGLQNSSPIYGRVTAHVQHRGWHYAAVYNGTDSYIMCGRLREEGEPGVGPYLWHGALVQVTGASVGAMWITSLTTPPRLYYGSGTNVAYFRLPSNGDNPLLDSAYRYAALGYLYLPADEWGLPGTRWQLTGWEIETEGLSAATYLKLYVGLDGGGWTYIQDVKTNGRATVRLADTRDWRFSRCALRIDIVNGSSTSTPRIRAVTGKARRRATVEDVVNTTLICSDEARSRYGVELRYSARQQVDLLKNYQVGAVIPMDDWWTGSKRTQQVLMMPLRERLIRQRVPSSDEFAVEEAVDVTLAVVRQAPAAALYGTAVYGTGKYS